ncbi:hypothetical protein HGRIS_005797 [Hohenbuehelia grisea]|uniref:Beta/gamma crystallin 'Greek key' domain-containing protein n=1 Tax=Hohenbuehelia grisea TaxID=104357 RepID=A0ABR3K079_9AGAR
MPPLHDEFIHNYALYMTIRNILAPETDYHLLAQQLHIDAEILIALRDTRYLQGRKPVLKLGNLHLVWEYAQDSRDHHRFVQMLRVTPEVFDVLLILIRDHPIFQSNSNRPQAPVQEQLAVTLFRLGRYGNGASVMDVARQAGISEGSVINYTDRCFTAIESLQKTFIRNLTSEEKEIERQWIDDQLGFTGGHWRDGWLMYDGTIVVLYKRPDMDGDAYYTRKGNYGLNVQIGNTPSNLRIVDFSHGMTGSAHDASAFEHTAAAKYPDWLFEGEEFAWTDSAYTVNRRTIPVHKEPASFHPDNILFDTTVSHIRVRSEHCMGTLKSRVQCLRGLRVRICNNRDHVAAMRWITVCCILHNCKGNLRRVWLKGSTSSRGGSKDNKSKDSLCWGDE